MIITKKEIDVTFIKKVTQHTFDINGKEVRIVEESYYSPDDTQEYDTNINEEDYSKLTMEEKDAIDEDVMELMRLDIGGTFEFDENWGTSKFQ